MKTRSFLLISACSSLLTLGGTAFSIAQTPSPSPSATPTATPTPRNHTANGNFRASGGQSGTYVETFTVADGTTTDAIVYTPADSTETSTVTLVSVANSDGTRTVTLTRQAFGETASFTSVTIYSARENGSFYGTGTYTTADGVAGALTSLVTRTGPENINATDYISTAGALTRELVIESRSNGGDNEKTLTVDSDGTPATTSITRFGGMHHHHP